MGSRSHSQKKPQHFTSAPTQNLVRSRPFAVPAQPETSQAEPPDLQIQLETASRLGHSFSKISASTPAIIQPKLTIGAPGDKYEQEADRVAAQVVQQIQAPAPTQTMADKAIQRVDDLDDDDDLQMKSVAETIQRDSDLDDDDDDLQTKPIVQRTTADSGMAASAELESAIQQSRGSGHPLADDLRHPLEHAFGGVDFSGVKVHTNAQSDQLNQSIQAKAFTTGQDIFFRQGTYQPGSRSGQELIAHELTHVVQQRGEGGMVTRPLVQRTLAYNQPIDIKDITTIKRVSTDKEVYVLSGNGTVVVKIETGSASEGASEGAARWENGLWLAKQILAGVPGAELINATERQILETLPDTLGADAQTLRESLKYYGSSSNFPQFPVKMETVQMGENLKERIDGAKTNEFKGGFKLTQVLDSDEVWTEMGKMAVFDLLMDNADRFQANGACNLENLDFTAGAIPALKPLDNFNPSVESTLRPGTVWKGKKVLKGGIAKTYVALACNHIYQEAYKKDAPDNCQEKFMEGMAAGRNAIYQLEPNLKLRILNLPEKSTQRATAKVLLGRIKSIKKK